MADMGGLLDFIKTPEGQGLLSATFGGLAGARNGTPWNNLGRAGMAGVMGYGNAQDRQAQQGEAEQMKKYRQAQMDNYQSEIDTRNLATESEKRKQAALPGLFTGGSPALAPLMAMPDAGILASPGRAATPSSLDVQAALQAGYTPDEISKLDGLRNIGLNKVERTVKGMVNGREVEQQMDNFGRPVGQGMEQYKAPIEVSTGANKMLLDPFTRQPLSTFKMEQSPDSRASNALGWANNAATLRGQDMTDGRARDLNDINRGEKKKVEDLTKGGQIASFDTMLGTLERLGKHDGLSRSVGMVGAFPTIPGSESANFKAELDTFQSQAFIPMVSQLKGMGALSDAEGKKLTAAVGALNPNMGEKAFRDSIARITDEMESARSRVSGQPRPNPKEPADQAISIPQGAANHLKMNPKLRNAFDAKYGQGAADKVLGK
jgi:hypothetical protein